eukprot:4389676-Alexandrium_andersonii.AAC.1
MSQWSGHSWPRAVQTPDRSGPVKRFQIAGQRGDCCGSRLRIIIRCCCRVLDVAILRQPPRN